MDRPIEKKKGIALAFTSKALPYWFGLLVAALILWLIFRDNSSTLRVNADTLSISEVTSGEFNDYIRISGQVHPMTTIQLSPREAGIVEEIVIEEGSQVKAGDVIIRLSNDDLDLEILNSEANLAEKENALRNTMIQMEQDKMQLSLNILELETEVNRKGRTLESQRRLYNEGLIGKEEYLRSAEDYTLFSKKLEVTLARAEQDSLYRTVQIDQMEESLKNMRINMQRIRNRKDNLNVKAPIDGELGLLDVVLGQSVGNGSKIGQINAVGSYKIEAQIDEHYIDRVSSGLTATFERQNETYDAVIRKVYPEVRGGKFQADFRFSGEQPANIRTGQTYYLNLQLGQPESAVLIPRGTFYQKTGGKWIYVVAPDGGKAVKREIRIGRQNPQFYEVLEGLEPGEKVITSGYDNFGDNEVLEF
ncbi:MAG: HlyD family efflux transporter periplasmic adaptor subunit [Bacteroidales bacterium]|nr:HlyD family efflux transporter periplasmic adaptor subunit [Bacteroidales bacterium]MBQ5582748.1 HlyD family efflux transporter periplasmic adaptor subunit [Bacteroidales bacterium]